MRRVIVESPFAGPTPALIARNIRYVRAAMRDCLLRKEAPFASHALYTLPGVLRDEVPEDRKLGMEAGWRWIALADATVVYTDLGMSKGMEAGIALAKEQNRVIEMRQLAPADLERVTVEPLHDKLTLAHGALAALITEVEDAMRDVDPAASWSEIKKRAAEMLRLSDPTRP